MIFFQKKRMPPKLDHIQRIRRENQTLSKLTPFNFCDYWCKHCLEDIRNVCQVYLHEDNVIRKSLETGDDLFSIDMILKKIESLVTGTSQHLDLLLEANPNSKSALKGEKLLEESDSCSNHPLIPDSFPLLPAPHLHRQLQGLLQ